MNAEKGEIASDEIFIEGESSEAIWVDQFAYILASIFTDEVFGSSG